LLSQLELFLSCDAGRLFGQDETRHDNTTIHIDNWCLEALVFLSTCMCIEPVDNRQLQDCKWILFPFMVIDIDRYDIPQISTRSPRGSFVFTLPASLASSEWDAPTRPKSPVVDSQQRQRVTVHWLVAKNAGSQCLPWNCDPGVVQ
jgi:hypothetical protein